MGGKRPDQFRIDPAETQSSDHKFRPKTPEEPNPHHNPITPAELFGRVMKGRNAAGRRQIRRGTRHDDHSDDSR
jgi:hypothetical protein